MSTWHPLVNPNTEESQPRPSRPQPVAQSYVHFHITGNVPNSSPPADSPPAQTTARATDELTRPALLKLSWIFCLMLIDMLFSAGMMALDAVVMMKEKDGKETAWIGFGRTIVTMAAFLWASFRTLDLYTRHERYYYGTNSQAESEREIGGKNKDIFWERNRRYLYAIAVGTYGLMVTFIAKGGFDSVVDRLSPK